MQDATVRFDNAASDALAQRVGHRQIGIAPKPKYDDLLVAVVAREPNSKFGRPFRYMATITSRLMSMSWGADKRPESRPMSHKMSGLSWLA